jgi:hypothetical protein
MPGGRRSVATFAVAVALVASVSGCSAPPPARDATPSPAPSAVAAPPVGAAFDYQLGGPSAVPDGVTVVARDRTAVPADAGYDICYVNGFQTQPDASGEWLAEHPDLILHVDGRPLADPDWPDELLLDASTDSTRAGIVDVVGPWIEACAHDGYDAVEIDNLDSFTRSHGAFDAEAATALARAYVTIAHDAGLAIGQKNAAELTPRMRALGFDFAVTESCLVYDECAEYTDVYEAVYDIEYTDELGTADFAAACASGAAPASAILRDPLLSPADDPAHVYDRC